MVFTNQGAVSLKNDPKTVKRDQKNLATFKGKVTASLNQLDIPISVYAATRRDKYRKPRNGMWEEMLEDYDLSSVSLDLEGSFFVGDAAGRPAIDGGGRDFSCCDRSVSILLVWFCALLSYSMIGTLPRTLGFNFIPLRSSF